MPLLDALQEKLGDALLPLAASVLTPRDAVLPDVPGKAHAVIGMRRAGKTCFLERLPDPRGGLNAGGFRYR
jgi:hypothetical protein